DLGVVAVSEPVGTGGGVETGAGEPAGRPAPGGRGGAPRGRERWGRRRSGGADVDVDAGVEGVRGVGDVPHRQDLRLAAVPAEVDVVRDRGAGPGPAVVDLGDLLAVGVVLPGAGGVLRGERPGEVEGVPDRGDVPALGVVVQFGEGLVAAAAAGQALGPLDA